MIVPESDKNRPPFGALSAEKMAMVRTLIAEKAALLGHPDDNLRLKPRDIIELAAVIRKVLKSC